MAQHPLSPGLIHDEFINHKTAVLADITERKETSEMEILKEYSHGSAKMTVFEISGKQGEKIHVLLQLGSKTEADPSLTSMPLDKPYTLAMATMRYREGRQCLPPHFPIGVSVQYKPDGRKRNIQGDTPLVKESRNLSMEQRMPIFNHSNALVVRANYGFTENDVIWLDEADFELVTWKRASFMPSGIKGERKVTETVFDLNHLPDSEGYANVADPIHRAGIHAYAGRVSTMPDSSLRSFSLERRRSKFHAGSDVPLVLTEDELSRLLDPQETQNVASSKPLGEFPRTFSSPEDVRKLFSQLVIDMLARDGKIF